MLAWFARLDPKVSRWGLALFIGALVFRLMGIDWGLPNADRLYSLHPDEDVVLVYSQQIKPAEGKFTPGFYNYPTLYLTMLRVGTDIANAYAPTGEMKTAADAARHRAQFNLVGRWISALAGAATVWVVFALLVHRVHDLAAFAGAAAVGFAPGHIVHSRFATVDVLGAFFVILSLYWAARWLQPGDPPDKKTLWRYALYAGLSAGLAAGTKYTGILALVGLFVAVVVVGRRDKDWKTCVGAFGAAVAVALASFLVTTPGAVLQPEIFSQNFQYELLHTSQGHGLVFAGTASGFTYHLSNLFLGFGLLLTLLGGFGLVWGTARRHAWLAVFLTFAVCYYLLIGRAEVKFFRYVLPLIPVLAVGVGWVFDRFHTNPNTRWRLANLLAILGVAGIGGGGLTSATVWTSWMALPDPRDSLGKEMKEQPGGSVGLVSDPWFYTPTLYPEASAPRFVPEARRREAMAAATNPSVVQYIPAEPEHPKPWDVRLILEGRPDRIVYSSFETEGLEVLSGMQTVPPEFTAQVQDFKEFIRTLNGTYNLEKVVAPVESWTPQVHDLMYIRPTLYVWKRKPPIAATPPASSTTSSSSGAPVGTP